MGVFAQENDEHGPYHDGEVEPNAPVVDVPKVKIDPPPHLVESVGLAASA
jgi:hypothetical protein